MTATSRRRQILISRIVSELTSVASQTQTQTHTHTQTPATSRRRQTLISRIVPELTSVASQTQPQTHTRTDAHTNTSLLSPKSTSVFAYSSRAYQCYLTNANTNPPARTQTLPTLVGLKRQEHVCSPARRPPLGEHKF